MKTQITVTSKGVRGGHIDFTLEPDETLVCVSFEVSDAAGSVVISVDELEKIVLLFHHATRTGRLNR